MQLYGEVNDLLSDLGQTPETFTGIILFMSMFNDISCDKKDNQEECLANAEVVSILAKKFGIGQWSSIGPGPRRSGILWKRLVHKDEMLLSRGTFKSKGHGKLSIHFTADYLTANQLSLLGAVANMCEEFEFHQDKSGNQGRSPFAE